MERKSKEGKCLFSEEEKEKRKRERGAFSPYVGNVWNGNGVMGVGLVTGMLLMDGRHEGSGTVLGY